VLVLVEERGRDRGDVRVAPVEQLASVLVDRYGLLRLPRRPISKPRLLGVAVLLGGVALITVGA
jgi:hypothetical protein